MIETIAPIEIEITVASGIEQAFRTFTAGIGSWWPVMSHSIGEARVTDVVLEPRAGGRLYERWDDGTEHEWGEVLEWDEPRRFVCSWNPNPEPSTSTEIEVRFEASGESTRVSLEHRGWERLGAEATELRREYTSGWPIVVELFARRCEDGPTSP